MLLDIFSRYVVGWMVAERESSALAARLIEQTCLKQGIEPQTLTLHSDRGAPMTSKCTAQLLADLGVTRSLSRPQVSDDNPFSEAQFKTLKYHPGFPGRFDDITAATVFCRSFFPPDYAPSSSCSADRVDCAVGSTQRPPRIGPDGLHGAMSAARIWSPRRCGAWNMRFVRNQIFPWVTTTSIDIPGSQCSPHMTCTTVEPARSSNNASIPFALPGAGTRSDSSTVPPSPSLFPN